MGHAPKRTGKIFMDYNMNARAKTLKVAYSPRGVPGATVSMPLTWEALETAHPTDFTMKMRGRGLRRRATRGKTRLASNRAMKTLSDYLERLSALFHK